MFKAVMTANLSWTEWSHGAHFYKCPSFPLFLRSNLEVFGLCEKLFFLCNFYYTEFVIEHILRVKKSHLIARPNMYRRDHLDRGVYLAQIQVFVLLMSLPAIQLSVCSQPAIWTQQVSVLFYSFSTLPCHFVGLVLSCFVYRKTSVHSSCSQYPVPLYS